MSNTNSVTLEQKNNSNTNADMNCVCPTSAKPRLAEVLSARIEMLATTENGLAEIAAKQNNEVKAMYHKARELAFLEAIAVVQNFR